MPVVSEVQINVPREVAKQVAIQDPDYEVIEEQTDSAESADSTQFVMEGGPIYSPAYRSRGTLQAAQPGMGA